MKSFTLSAPWYEYANKLKVLFENDEDIVVDIQDDAVRIRVANTDKYEALTHLLPEAKKFGNVTYKIIIIPANKGELTTRDYLRNLFKGNEAVHRIEDIVMGSNPMTFIEFEKEVIQYYNDNLSDLHGNCTTVLEQVAREVFDNQDGVYFCTDNGMDNENGPF